MLENGRDQVSGAHSPVAPEQIGKINYRFWRYALRKQILLPASESILLSTGSAIFLVFQFFSALPETVRKKSAYSEYKTIILTAYVFFIPLLFKISFLS